MSLPANYSDALTYLYGEEGGYTVDAGGPTRWGVTEAVARSHGYAGDMRDYPIEEASRVYKPDYWDAVRADELPEAVRFAVFDLAVNSGPHEACRILQRAAGVVDDGELGPQSMAAIASASPDALLRKVCGYRELLMIGLGNWPVDGKGWIRRVATILVA